MKETPLGIDDGDRIEGFDPSTVTATDGGAESIVVATGDQAYTTVESAAIEIDLGEPIDNYTGVAAGDTVAVVADETVYRISGGLASHQRPVKGALDVFTGPNDDCLTVLCADGRLVWLDPAAKLREVGAKQTEIDPTGIVAAAAAGWTALSDGESVYCYQEPADEQVAIVEIGPTLFDGTIRDLSFVDGCLVIATTDEVVSFDPAADFERQWILEQVVTGLSNPARNHVYGWNDDLVRITADGQMLVIAETGFGMATTVDHSKWYVEQNDEATIRERGKAESIELLIDSIAYRDREPVIAEVTNPTTDQIDYELTVSATNLEIRSDSTSHVSVPPLSRTSIKLATVSPRERVQSGSVAVKRTTTGEQLAERSVTVTYGVPNIQATASLSEIGPNGPTYTVTAHNSGTGVAFLDTADPPTRKTWYRIAAGERVELTDAVEEELYMMGADPDISTEPVDIKTDTTLPDEVCSVSCSLGPTEDLLRLAVKNHTSATLRDTVTVDVENGPNLSGTITVEPEGQSTVWLDVPKDLPPILRVTVTGSLINEVTRQVSDHRLLGLERRFFDTNGSSVDLNRVPLGNRFEERLTIRNDTDETLTETTVGGVDGYTLPDLLPSGTTTLSRQVVLPTRESSVPSVTIGDLDNQIKLPERDKPQRLQSLKLQAAIQPTNEGFNLLIEVECRDRDFTVFVLESLRLDGEPLLDSVDVDRRFAVGETHQRQLSFSLDSPDRIQQRQSDTPQPVTAEFSKSSGKVQHERSTLAPIVDTGYVPTINPRIEIKQSKFMSSDKHRLILKFSDTIEHDVIVAIKNKDGKSIKSFKIRDEMNRIGREFRTDEKKLSLSIKGTGQSSINNVYVFRRYSKRWHLKNRKEQTPFPTGPVVTPWIESS